MRSLAFLLWAMPALAADEEGRFAIEGPGGLSCASLVQLDTRGAPELAVIGGWAQGYMTALQRLTPETYDLTPWQGIVAVMGQVLRFCHANGSVSLETALWELARYLHPDRLPGQDEIVEVRSGERQILIYAGVLSRAREALRDLGHDPGATEDAERQREAIRRFQKIEGLPETGLPDQATLLRLFR